MSLFLIPFLMSAALAQDAAPPAPPSAPATPAAPSASDAEAKAALVAACAKLANAKSYAFELKSESTGGGFGRGGDGGSGGGESGGPRVATPIKAEFQSGLPMHLVQGETDAYLHEGKLVHKNRDGVWAIYDREAMRNRSGGPGGGGDGAGRASGGEGGSGAQGGGAASGGQGGTASGGAASGGQAGAGGTDGAGATGEKAAGGETAAQDGNRGGRGGGRNSRGSLGTLQSVLTPQALVKDVESKVVDVVREDRDGKVVFKGKLSEAAALALTSFGRGGRGSRDGGDGGGPERKASGLFEIVVAPDGAIESILLDTDTTMEFGDRSVDMKRKSTYSISNVDHVEVKVPDEAMTHFEV